MRNKNTGWNWLDRQRPRRKWMERKRVVGQWGVRKVNAVKAEKSNEVMRPLTSWLKHREGRGWARDEEEMTMLASERPDEMNRRWQRYQRNNRKALSESWIVDSKYSTWMGVESADSNLLSCLWQVAPKSGRAFSRRTIRPDLPSSVWIHQGWSYGQACWFWEVPRRTRGVARGEQRTQQMRHLV